MLFIFLVLSGYGLCAKETLQSAFITRWKTNNPGSSGNNQVTIPSSGTGYHYTVHWVKVNDPSISGKGAGPYTGDVTLTFPIAGIYRVSISGDFPRIFFNDIMDKEKILAVEQWGTNPWQSMHRAFQGCSNLAVMAEDVPNLQNVTDMSYMFSKATSFDQPIGLWDVSNVTNMSHMFFQAYAFNQSIEDWDVGKVKDMSVMFFGASSFNQFIGSWDVGNVTDMSAMFSVATAFNQDIGNWDISSTIKMSRLFRGARKFNQSLGKWNVSKVIDMGFMLNGSGLSVANNDATLMGWAALPSLQHNVNLQASGLQYCNGKTARNTLMNTHNWNIKDEGANCTLMH